MNENILIPREVRKVLDPERPSNREILVQQFATQSLRKFLRAVDEAGDWFYTDDISLHQRTRQASSAILRFLHKLSEESLKQGFVFDDVLGQMYLIHAGRRKKK